MSKLKTIKQIVDDFYAEKNVCTIGTVVTKKECRGGSVLHFQIQSNGHYLECKLTNENEHYNELKSLVKLEKTIYVDGECNFTLSSLYIKDVKKDFDYQYFLDKDCTNEIKLHLLIEEGKEKEAIDLIESDGGLNVNEEFMHENLLLHAFSKKMFRLSALIMDSKKFYPNIIDGFGETLLEDILYYYQIEGGKMSDDNKKQCETLIANLIDNEKIDLNQTDLNEDTALMIACESTESAWVVGKLLGKENVGINVVDDFDYSALTNAIRFNNVKAIELLSTRNDLIVRDIDLEEAEKNCINLEKFGIKIAATVNA